MKSLQGKVLKMHIIKKISQLKQAGLSQNQISASLNVSKGSVNKYLNLLQHHSKSSPVSDIDSAIAAIATNKKAKTVVDIDFNDVSKELCKKGVTLQLLHAELQKQYNISYSYTHFCHLYRQYKKSHNLEMRHVYTAGEIMYVDYSGLTVPVADYTAEIFVAILAASNYIYVEATRDQKLQNWIQSHCNAFNFFGGSPKIVIPDNLKSAVTKPHRYSPLLNKSYRDCMEHYHCIVVPARVYRPRDKGKVENAVGLVQRQILARLRQRHYTLLTELNQDIKSLLAELNAKPLQKRPDSSRRSLFLELEQACLTSLPCHKYNFIAYESKLVGRDYHVAVANNYYSVPYRYARHKVTIALQAQTIEILSKDQRIAMHVRQHGVGQYITIPEHMPEKHRAIINCKPQDILAKLPKQGSDNLVTFVSKILANNTSSILTYKLSGRINSLLKMYTIQRLEQACAKLIRADLFSLDSLESMLDKSFDFATDHTVEESTEYIEHDNLRGEEYYQKQYQKKTKTINTSEV